MISRSKTVARFAMAALVVAYHVLGIIYYLRALTH
jgi:hypothetical protein